MEAENPQAAMSIRLSVKVSELEDRANWAKNYKGGKKKQQKIKLSKGVSLLQVKCLSCLHSEHILVLKEQSQHPK